MNTTLSVAVICPVFNEENYIAKCIESIIRQNYLKGKLELIFVDGGSTDKTVEIIESYIHVNSFIRLLRNPDKFVPFGMNIGIKSTDAEVIVRIDAHSLFPTNYISCLVNKLVLLNADNVGCVCKTEVLVKTPKSVAIRAVLSDRFGVGNSYFRIGSSTIKEVDTVPFGCYRKDVFSKYGLYDTRLYRNQDIELNKRIKSAGGRIYLIPGLYFTYFARSTYRKLARNNYENGKWNLLTIYLTKNFKSLSIRHFVPFLFLISLFLSALLFLLFDFSYLIFCAIFTMYSIAAIIVSIKLSNTQNCNFIYVLLGFFLLHFSYGFGSLSGLLSIIRMAWMGKRGEAR